MNDTAACGVKARPWLRKWTSHYREQKEGPGFPEKRCLGRGGGPRSHVLGVLLPVEMSVVARTGQHRGTSSRRETPHFLSRFLLIPGL